MLESQFRALLLQKEDKVSAQISDLPMKSLPDGDVLIRVSYSSLNYKDALAVTNQGKIVSSYPFIPGIDAVGEVVQSEDDRYQKGDGVIVTGWGLGETHWGGLSEYIRVPSGWLVPLPKMLSAKQSMIVGTAGLTAMLCVMALEEQGCTPEKGEVVVTGAAGGVGSFAIQLLASLGYQVVASTGRTDEEEYLLNLGASRIIDRSYLSSPSKPLESQLFAGAVDTVGGSTLSGLFSRMKYYGIVAACGLAQDQKFTSTVFPFILRGVKLVGVESVIVPVERRIEAWERIAQLVPSEKLEMIVHQISLEQVPQVCDQLISGKVRGRVIVKIK